ncbi:MAG: phosphatase PAP2 family protein, partial [Anaerolineae bacterium]
MLTRLDLWLFGTINGLAGRVGWLDALGRLLVNDYLLPSALALMLLWLWLSGRTPMVRRLYTGAVVNAFVAQFIANLILKLINLSYFRPRPFDPDPTVNLLFYRPWDSSCPSNPATFGFAVATAIYLASPRLGRWALGVATVWGLARVYCGVHYPLDVILGAGLGA